VKVHTHLERYPAHCDEETMHTDAVNIIFGMKLRQARMQANLSLSELATRADLSPSYVTEIEKGRKYPKSDKIFKIAQVLGKTYDELVSIKLSPALTDLESMLASPLLRQFPFEEFDLDINDLIGLLTRAPDKASALLHAVFEIARQYDMKDEHFLRAALRSYQELHDNYFPELEDAATAFALKHRLHSTMPVSLEALTDIISNHYGYHLDDTRLADYPELKGYRAVFFEGQPPTLLLNPTLYPLQRKFLLARELGYAFLGIKERSHTSTPDRVESFRQVFNDFRASYFAGALLMPQERIVADVREFFGQERWNPAPLQQMLITYDVTPEMLLYRFSEIVPQFFGATLHFLRFHNATGEYQLIKRLNMNRLLLPSGIGLHEHYCRRWLSSRLLMKLAEQQNTEVISGLPLVDVQMSEFLESKERFLCIGFARPLVLTPNVGSSVIVGFRMTNELKNTIRFANDPSIPVTVINETCERCPLTLEECSVRSAPPTILLQNEAKAERRLALSRLQQSLN
jgi:transcriptional regulator with XRE-family HTH domain